MRYISAPWRAAYVRGAAAASGCLFCRAVRGRDDAAAAVLFRGRHHVVLLNRFPYTPGHLMIAPKRHLADFTQARPAERAELADLLRAALRILRRRYAPHGFNAGMNLGRSAGAGVAGHYHLHIVPRWTGDSNFMPLVAGARVFIEDLRTTYDRLRPLFDELQGRPRGEGRARRSSPIHSR